MTFSGVGEGSWDSDASAVSELALRGTVRMKRTMQRTGVDDREGDWDGTFELRVVNRWIEPRAPLKLPAPRPK